MPWALCVAHLAGAACCCRFLVRLDMVPLLQGASAAVVAVGTGLLIEGWQVGGVDGAGARAHPLF